MSRYFITNVLFLPLLAKGKQNSKSTLQLHPLSSHKCLRNVPSLRKPWYEKLYLESLSWIGRMSQLIFVAYYHRSCCGKRRVADTHLDDPLMITSLCNQLPLSVSGSCDLLLTDRICKGNRCHSCYSIKYCLAGRLALETLSFSLDLKKLAAILGGGGPCSKKLGEAFRS